MNHEKLVNDLIALVDLIDDVLDEAATGDSLTTALMNRFNLHIAGSDQLSGIRDTLAKLRDALDS